MVVGQEWNDTDKIVGRATLTVADVQGAFAGRTGTRLLVVFVVLSLAMLGVTLLVGGTKMLPGLVVLPFFLGLVWYFRRVQAKTVLASKSEMDLTHSYELDSDGYRISSHNSASRATWSTLYTFQETADAFLLFQNPTVRIIIPKRAFAANDIPRIQKLLAACVHRRRPGGGPARVLVLWVVLIIAFVAIYHLVGTQPAPAPQRTPHEDEQPL